MVTNLPDVPHILDLGCGTGSQTIALAKLLGGHIIALDKHQPYLDVLSQQAQKEHLSNVIKPVRGDLLFLDFPDQSFDLIWSEGAIYIAGFKKGIMSCKPLLKKNGYLVVSEISWTDSVNRPSELKEFWNKEYPGMKSIQESLKIIRESGFELVHYFPLPEEDWWTHLYHPLNARLKKLREKYSGNTEALEMIEYVQKEIHFREIYADHYGYFFYIMKKSEL
ncbi:MAG: class I SAM-dependent methyltransferase [Bacteroidetes bacterium]|nr:class I SAM-dependent methyltransferase [Bacteroidota bacterium]